ncbi:hypothetical protein XJ32_03070 [Helicobacter bilis]|uniref:Uncharacterized protein n=1 Tax=Helicobacter bilis TaxID=37372 RepID=A0A1Q2LGK2_9HELI|nr:T6SS effector amidase Tae4 family protein [Helicobacter bilis]AQQ59247.1 hypothetical protein XJ32_03070 [Helicobacter bilis]
MLGANVWRVKCGNKEITIKIQRPDFASVESAYREITREGADEFIKNYKLTQPQTQDELNQLSYIMAEARYKKISQVLLNFYNDKRKERYNTCATRVSYAINNSTVPLHMVANKKDLPVGLWGIGGKYYYISVDGIINALSIAWHKPKKLDDKIKQSILCGYSEDFYKEMTSKYQNATFFNELVSFNKKGIVAMRMQHNRLRHTTLWNGSNFVDVEMNKEVEIHIFGYDYLNDSNKSYPHITQFYFWELK